MTDRTWQEASTGTGLLTTPTRRRVAAGTVTAGIVDTRIELAAFDDRSAADRAAFAAAAGPIRRPAPQAGDDDHGKTKDPLPPRPRGPHPYPTGAVT